MQDLVHSTSASPSQPKLAPNHVKLVNLTIPPSSLKVSTTFTTSSLHHVRHLRSSLTYRKRSTPKPPLTPAFQARVHHDLVSRRTASEHMHANRNSPNVGSRMSDPECLPPRAQKENEARKSSKPNQPTANASRASNARLHLEGGATSERP